MSQAVTDNRLRRQLERHEADSKSIFGFWVYLMTDCILFASLFATYAVLHNNTAGGPGGSELFSLPFVLIETLILLTSSFTSGLALLAARRQDLRQTLVFFGITFLLGLFFLTMELTEFHKLAEEGNSWTRSGFLSAFFTLVGTHGLHITAGLLWMGTLMFGLLRRGFQAASIRQLTMLSLFWHFLDIVWIFIFTIVYLLGEHRMSRHEVIVARHETAEGSLASYSIGFGLSIALTLAAYLLVVKEVLSGWGLVSALAGLAVTQLLVQLVFFLHLGRESRPRWNLWVLLFAVMVLVIVVFGSLWIMKNLEYQHGGHNHLTPRETDEFLIKDEGYNKR